MNYQIDDILSTPVYHIIDDFMSVIELNLFEHFWRLTCKDTEEETQFLELLVDRWREACRKRKRKAADLDDEDCDGDPNQGEVGEEAKQNRDDGKPQWKAQREAWYTEQKALQKVAREARREAQRKAQWSAQQRVWQTMQEALRMSLQVVLKRMYVLMLSIKQSLHSEKSNRFPFLSSYEFHAPPVAGHALFCTSTLHRRRSEESFL